MKTFFKIFALIFSILFLVAAILQYNDPDAFLWYSIYGVAAVVSFLFFLGRLKYYVAAILCVAYLAGVFAAWPVRFEGVSIGRGDIVNIEEGREALGLLITSWVMLCYALRLRFGRRS